ncbi:MAG TPA: heavy metal-associated domain-containing protein [Terracidiphilus sp.]|nr:heavy metal-associated domain-containing protein [Terracidiphilus sp.]
MENIVKLSIEGMHCDGCVRRVTNALMAVEGLRVESVQVGSATVAIDPASVAPEQVMNAVDRIGFTAHLEH